MAVQRAQGNVKEDAARAVSALFLEGKKHKEEEYWSLFATVREHAPIITVKEGDFWLATGFDECQTVLTSRSARLLFAERNDVQAPGWRLHRARVAIGEWFSAHDGPAHADVRKPMNSFFLPQVMADFQPKVKIFVRVSLQI